MNRRLPVLFLIFCLQSGLAFAFPNAEKTSLSLISSQATSMVMEGDQFIYLSFGGDIFRIDTTTQKLATDQIPSLKDNSKSGGKDLTGSVVGLAIRGRTLFASQADGDLLFINLDNITAAPDTKRILSGTLGPLVADTEVGTDDDKLYILDKSNNAVIVYDISDGKTVASIPTVNSVGAAVTPISVTFVPFPTTSASSSVDKVFVTSNTGLVFVINEGGTGIAATIALSGTNKDLPAAAASPGGDFLLVVNATDSTVPVINTAANAEVDTDSTKAGVNPVSMAPNSLLKGVAVTDVVRPTDTYAYVTGTSGVSVIDLNISGGAFSDPTLKDTIKLSSVPGLIAASSAGDGFVYTSNGNAGISVISDNPLVTISSTSLGSSSLTASNSFTVTFKSDEAGTYRVLAGGGITATGKEVASGTVSAPGTDVTTVSISYNASAFSEGTNRIFVFVTDAAGNAGRQATSITVDTPPPAVTILDTGFGRKKIYVTFGRLTASDIDHYNIYVDKDSSLIATKTDKTATVAQAASGDSLDVTVGDLLNGTTYFIGIEGADKAGNVGPRTTTLSNGSAASEKPESTRGLVEVTGEAGGCSLLPSLSSKETPPRWWSLDVKGGIWLPKDATTKNLLGTCCHPGGAIEFGFLYKSRFGVEVGAGYNAASGEAVGITSGKTSQEGFSFLMIPFQNSLTFRADFKEDQLFVPYAKFGLDYLFFRENLSGQVTKGLKMGLHTAAGLQILLNRLEDLSGVLEGSKVFFTLEGRYGWINGFGAKGVDLSGYNFSGGLLFEF